MKKSQNKNKQAKQANPAPRKPRAAKPKERPRNTDRANVLRAVHNICGLTDPFCKHARGIKYPDDSSVKTLAFTYENMLTWSVDAAGTTGAICLPQWNYNPVAGSSIRTGPTVSGWGSFPGDTKFGSNIVQSYRIVSAGMRFQVVAAPLNLSGAIHIRHFPNETLSDFGNVDLLTMTSTNKLDLPLRDCDDLVVLFQRTSQDPKVFYPAANDTGTVIGAFARGFAPFTVYIDGAQASSTVVQVTTVINFEVIFTDGTTNNALVTNPPPNNSYITNAASFVSSTLEPYAVAGLNSFGNYVVRKAETAIMRYLAPPVAGMALLSL